MENLSYGGIDVSKDRRTSVVLPEGWFFSVSNDTAGWAELVARLRPLAVCAIGLEPSGGYERGIIRALLAAGLSVRRINPNKLRQFARARGVLAKNDRLDARLIAEYVAIMPTRVVQRDDAVERLAEIVTMRRQLCDEHVAVENQAGHLEDVMLRRLYKRRLIRLEADIRLLDKRLTEMVATNAAFAQLYELLTSMRGVGPVLAFTLIALLPELGKMSRKQIAALVGLAPYDFDSGKLRGHRSIYGGRMPIRNVLYMAALSASRYNPALRAFSNCLADANKKSKVVIVAVMRKMITTLNAMLRDNTAWQSTTEPTTVLIRFVPVLWHGAAWGCFTNAGREFRSSASLVSCSNAPALALEPGAETRLKRASSRRSEPIALLKVGRRRLMPNLEQVTCSEPTVAPINSAISSRLVPRSTRFLICCILSGVNFICRPRVPARVPSSAI